MIPNDGYIRWQCRRGMLELDVPLTRFCQKHLAVLSDKEKMVFLEMLSEQDPLWLSWLVGESKPKKQAWAALLMKIMEIN